MKFISFSPVALLIAVFCINFLDSCSKTQPVTPSSPAVDSLKIGLSAYYTFNNTGVDSSGNKNNASLYNITSATDRFGNVNGAYYFNGTSSYLSVPDNQSLRLSNTDFTLNAWINTVAYNSNYAENILAKRITGANNGWIFGILGDAVSPTGVIDFGPGGGAVNSFATTPVSLNQWHMLTIVYIVSKLQMSMYVDGAQIGTVTGSYSDGFFSSSSTGVVSPSASENALMYIGRDDPSQPNGYFFNGSMDDIRIYSRAVSLKQIGQLFTAKD